MTQRWINNDVYIYERKFFDSVVLVAINKNEISAFNISGLKTSLPAGPYVRLFGRNARRSSDNRRSLVQAEKIRLSPSACRRIRSQSGNSMRLPARHKLARSGQPLAIPELK